MLKEYEILHQPVTVNGKVIDKYNVYYYINGELELSEFLGYSLDNLLPIREGYEQRVR